MAGDPFEDPNTGVAAGDLDQVFAGELAALVVVGSDERFGGTPASAAALASTRVSTTTIGTLASFAFTRADTISREPLGVMQSAWIPVWIMFSTICICFST